MSTTAVVTPYEPEVERIRNEMTVREEKAVAKLRAEMRKDRLKGIRLQLAQLAKTALSSPELTVNTGSISLLKKAAESIGYTARVTEQSAIIELIHSDGSLINLSRTNSGKVVLSSPKNDLGNAKLIVREYTTMQVVKHLKARGMKVQARRTDQGEIAIEARSAYHSAVVNTDIRNDGVAVIDISGMKGKGCQEIITGISGAIDGSQIDAALKNDYYTNSDERRHVSV